MGLLAQLRTSLENPQTPLSYPAEWLLDIFNGGRTDSGLRVSEKVALQATTVLACVNLISGAMGSLELRVYERMVAKDKRASKRVAYEHDLFDLLHFEPNPEMSSFTFRNTLQCHALLWGNLYAEIQRNDSNGIVGIWPRNPARIRPYRLGQPIVIKGEKIAAGELVYKTTEGLDEISPPDYDNPPSAPERVIAMADVLHIPGLALDGRLGESTVQLARQAIGLQLATEKFGAKFFGNGAHGRGVLEHPATLSKPALENLRRSFVEAYGGENAHKPMILEEGMKWTETSTKPDDAQFLETRKFQVAETCRIFGVPPHMVADTEKTNRANVEQIGIEFLAFGLSRWLKAWEQELRRKLFPRTGRSANKFFALFDTRPLTMPDATSRKGFYDSGKQWGWLSSNDVREMENLNPIDDDSGDGYWMPINMQDMETAYGEPAQGPGPADPDQGGGKISARYVRAYFRLFFDSFRRISADQAADRSAFEKAFQPVLGDIAGSLTELATGERSSEPLDEEISRFVSEYLGGMQRRADQWRQANGDAEKVAERELARAVRGIWIEVNRSLATKQAKKRIEEEVAL